MSPLHSTRGRWTFKILGHDEVAILDGGFAGWQQQGFDVASGAVADVEPKTFEVSLREELLATTEQVEQARQDQAQLVDARPSDYFVGESVSPAVRDAGTIPGARSLPHHRFVLSEIAGFDNVAMYDGSMAAWTVSESRPVQLARRGLERLQEALD